MSKPKSLKSEAELTEEAESTAQLHHCDEFAFLSLSLSLSLSLETFFKDDGRSSRRLFECSFILIYFVPFSTNPLPLL